MRSIILKCIPLLDVLLALVVFPAALVMKLVRRMGVQRMPVCKKALLGAGVFPVLDHYYEPQFDFRDLKQDLSEKRALPGIDWNVSSQLDFLGHLAFAAELENVPAAKIDVLEFHHNNGAFEFGDADMWYQVIRSMKPRKIVEIGSGHSTLMATRAIKRNREDMSGYACDHVCIEPYEMPWLDQLDVSVVRSKVEDVDMSVFTGLGDGDLLFIDSSHIIRPQGDVLFEYLEILPRLGKGVVVHIHDIFTPRDYPEQWIKGEVRMWNEQYLLEAFLTHNASWEVLGSVNYLHGNHYDQFKKISPSSTPQRGGGSIYLRKVA
ncbi:MAG TPA: class I SAM-dependent methyltransferase [Oleiagrimonas sp.]|nr:class I SAM-dependent methyltransferase [Oleiagrimonas sp.]